MKPLEKIIVVGGGTAGWLTSFLLSKHKPNIKCLTIDSSKLGSIGVGEGTTEINNIVKMYLKDTIENISYTYDLQTLNEKLQKDKE
jgi:cysteine synthase